MASDSDSDSDIGKKKGEKDYLKDYFLQSTSRSAIIASTCEALGEVFIAPVYFYLVEQQRHQQQQMTCLEKLMTYLQTAMQRSLQLQASPWYLIQEFLNLIF